MDNIRETYETTGLLLIVLAECGLFPLLNRQTHKRRTKRERRTPVRIVGYIERVLPHFTQQQFQSNFRLTRNAYEKLLPIIHGFIKRSSTGRLPIDTERQLLSVIWLLATPESYRSVGERFNLGKSSLSDSFFRIIKILNRMAPNIISWPVRMEEIKTKFRRMGGINNIIGAIDGTYIAIKAPQENPDTYITRKCYHAITLQAICDPNLKYTDCFVGYPGSVSDTRIFYNSDIYQNIRTNAARYFPDGEFLVGDKAYPVLPYLIPPYIDCGNLNAAKRYFNMKISQTRQTVERSFALLFGRFRRLKFLDMNLVHFIPATVLACCVLHNVCLDSSDLHIEEYIREGIPYVRGNDEIDEIQLEQDNLNFEQNNGSLLRDNLCRQLYNNVI